MGQSIGNGIWWPDRAGGAAPGFIVSELFQFNLQAEETEDLFIVESDD